MKPLVILILVFVVSLGITFAFKGEADLVLSGNVAMAVMLLFTAIGHFAFTRGMTMMMPDIIPFKTAMVYLTGLIEIAAAVGLLMFSTRALTGWLLIAFFICILPANVNAAIKGVDFQKATLEGDGVRYLWFRVPLQILFIVWTYFFAIKL